MIVERLIVAIGADLDGLSQGLDQALSEAERASRGIIAAAARMERQIQDSHSRAGDAAAEFGERLQNIGSRLTVGVTLPIVAIGAAALAAATDFDLAMTGVAKTVDLPAAALEQMGKDFREMSETMPTTAVELAGVAEAAGQLGVAGDKITAFTKVMADMGVATDLSAEEAAVAIARFTNITGMSLDNVDRLGSTIVALGNAGASTEREITEMGLRLAGAGAQIGLAESEILAFASALSSVGIEAEAGGSAFSKVFIQIATAVATGNEDLQMFADIAGKSAADFRTAFQQDAAGAIISFVQGLSQMDSESGEVLLALEALGIKEVRMRDALLRASGASDMFNASLQTANAAFEENTALQAEAERFYGATANQLKALRNEAVNVAGAFGEQMMPAFNAAISGAGKLLDVFDSLSPTTMNLMIGFGAAAAALPPVIVAVGTLLKILPLLQANFAFLAATGGPILLGVAAFGALVAAGLALVQNWRVISYEAGQLVDKVTGPFKTIYEKIVGHSYIPDLIDGIRDQFARLDEVMVRPALAAAATVDGAFGRLRIPTTLTPSAGGASAGAAAGGAGDSVGKAMAALTEGAAEAGNILSGSFGPQALVVAGIMEVVAGALEPLQPILDVFSRLLQAIGKVIGSALAPVLRIVAVGFSYVVQAIGWFVEGIGKFIDSIVPDWVSKVGKGLAKQGQELQESAKASRKALDETMAATESTKDLGKAMDETTDSVRTANRNLPSWYRVSRGVYGATAPMPAGGTAGAGPGVDNSVSIDTAQITVVSGGPGESPQELALKVVRGLRMLRMAGRTTDLDVMIAEATV